MKIYSYKLRQTVIFLGAVLSICVLSCGDDDEPATPSPVISGFTPSSGLPDATVTITGENFSTTAAENIVSFNGTPATVVSATETTLVVTIPDGATAGPISVTVNGVKVTSSFSFTPLNTTITSFTPESGVPGTVVTISGTNFSTTASENIVKFNGIEAEVTAATATTLTVIVPADASDGKITVAIHDKVTTSANLFTIAELEVTETFPPIAAVGISVKISGTNFSPVAEYNVVKFNGVPATVTAVSENEVTVLVPQGATTGPLTVKVGNHTVEALTVFAICSGGPELVISDAVASKTAVGTSYTASFTITNVGSEDADVSKIVLQNYASTDDVKGGDVAAGGYTLSSAPVLAPGESYSTGNYGGSVGGGGNTSSHPYLIITLYDTPDGAVPECNVDNNVLAVPFE
jgi:hypothetical protein